MAVALSDLKAYANITKDDNDALLGDCLQTALALTSAYIEGASVPDSILDRARLIVALDLWERRKAPNGIANQQFQSADGVGQAPARIARDPMAGAYPLLRPWVMPF